MREPAPTSPGEVAPALRVAAGYAWRLLLVAAAAAVVVHVLTQLMLVVVPVLAALFLAAVLDMPAGWMRGRGMPSWAAAVLTLLGAAALLALVAILIVPSLVGQFSDLDFNLQRALERVEELLAGIVPVTEADLRIALRSAIDALQAEVRDITTGYMTVARQTAEVLLGLFITAFALFFFLKDGGRIFRGFCHLVPERRREDTAAIGERVWDVLRRFLLGLVFVAVVDAALIGLALVIIGVPLVVPLAVITFLGAFIPFVGATVAGLVAALVALVSGGVTDALLVVGAVLLVQQIEGNILYPLIVGRQVRLHPLAILLAVTAGGLLAGLLGAFLAVPVTAVVVTIVNYLRSAGQERRRAAENAGPTEPPALYVPDRAPQRVRDT